MTLLTKNLSVIESSGSLENVTLPGGTACITLDDQVPELAEA